MVYLLTTQFPRKGSVMKSFIFCLCVFLCGLLCPNSYGQNRGITKVGEDVYRMHQPLMESLQRAENERKLKVAIAFGICIFGVGMALNGMMKQAAKEARSSSCDEMSHFEPLPLPPPVITSPPHSAHRRAG